MAKTKTITQPKRRGRPPGATNKPKAPQDMVGIDRLMEANKRIEALESRITSLVNDWTVQEIGYQAVISYLEEKVENMSDREENWR